MIENRQNKDIDKHTGVETTGHNWDGIKELNNPAPRWWLWIFIISCVWALGYWLVYPSWPVFSEIENARGGTKGKIGWTQYKQLKSSQAEIIARKSAYLKRFQFASFEEISNDPELYAFAISGGKSAFKDNCATCHGTGGEGAKGYPNLNDDDWLWGGSVNEIFETIKYGIRSKHDETRISQMPSFEEILDKKEIDTLAFYVKNLSEIDDYFVEYQELYDNNCASCHGEKGYGNKDVGAPNLADKIWFYIDGDINSISEQIKYPKHGVMPNWNERLNEETLRQLAIFVFSLGGGE